MLVLLVATTSFSAYAAFQAKDTAKAAALQTSINHQTGLQNNNILHSLSGSISRHTQTISQINAVQRDLDTKFTLVVRVDQAACRNAPKTQANTAVCKALDKAIHQGLTTPTNTHSP
jgi:hypothetical protein